MDKHVKDVFNDLCGELSFDNKLGDKIIRYMNSFISKNVEHASFFGGNLTGVYVVKFTNSDRSVWFDEILNINEEELLKLMAEREDLKFITDIKPDADEEFLKFTGRYFSTPKKMGAQTAEANLNAGVAAAKQINAFFETGDTTFQVNK